MDGIIEIEKLAFLLHNSLAGPKNIFAYIFGFKTSIFNVERDFRIINDTLHFKTNDSILL